MNLADISAGATLIILDFLWYAGDMCGRDARHFYHQPDLRGVPAGKITQSDLDSGRVEVVSND